jgi:hypothetical protein
MFVQGLRACRSRGRASTNATMGASFSRENQKQL